MLSRSSARVLGAALAFALVAAGASATGLGCQGDSFAGDPGAGGDGGGGGDGARDGGSGEGGGDASGDGGSADGAGDGAVNLVVNGGFESGAGGCGAGWNASLGLFDRSAAARAGAASCELCTAGDPSYELRTTSSVMVGPGSYYAEAWLLGPTDGGVAADAVGVQVIVKPLDGGAPAVFQGAEIAAGATWTKSGIDFPVTESSAVDVAVHAYEPTGCVLIDDVALYAQTQ